MKNNIITAGIILLFLFAACDNPDNSEPGLPSAIYTPITVDYSAAGPDISTLLGWQWVKDGTGDVEFTWIFEDDGTISVIHCCEEVFPNNFSYLLCGNILVTYGSEMEADKIEAGTITMTDLSFTRYNGSSFTRGDVTDSSDVLSLSNNLLGTWQMGDGTEYEFKTDAGLIITSPLGEPEQYGYLIRSGALLTLGPLVDGTKVVLREYTFNKIGSNLSLSSKDGVNYTFSRVE